MSDIMLDSQVRESQFNREAVVIGDQATMLSLHVHDVEDSWRRHPIHRQRLQGYQMRQPVDSIVYYAESGYFLWTLPGFYGHGASLQEAEDDLLWAMTEALEVLSKETVLDGELRAKFDILKEIFAKQ